MTQFTLSKTTQNLINLALSQGPGTSNVNYVGRNGSAEWGQIGAI